MSIVAGSSGGMAAIPSTPRPHSPPSRCPHCASGLAGRAPRGTPVAQCRPRPQPPTWRVHASCGLGSCSLGPHLQARLPQDEGAPTALPSHLSAWGPGAARSGGTCPPPWAEAAKGARECCSSEHHGKGPVAGHRDGQPTPSGSPGRSV